MIPSSTAVSTLAWVPGGQRADLIEEQASLRPAASKKPDPGALGVRESPALVSEELRFGQRLGQRGAVDRDEGSALARAVAMHPARPGRFARANSVSPSISKASRLRSRRRSAARMVSSWARTVAQAFAEEQAVRFSRGLRAAVLLAPDGAACPPAAEKRQGSSSISKGLAADNRRRRAAWPRRPSSLHRRPS